MVVEPEVETLLKLDFLTELDDDCFLLLVADEAFELAFLLLPETETELLSMF